MAEKGCPQKTERCLPASLGLNKQLSALPLWLVNENHTLSEQQVLAWTCHIVPMHGALSPMQAVLWGLEGLYNHGPNPPEATHVPSDGGTY